MNIPRPIIPDPESITTQQALLPDVPVSNTTTTAPAVTKSTSNLTPGQSLVAHATGSVEIFAGPDQPVSFRMMEEATILGSPRVFLVVEGPIDGWVKISLPLRPNGSTGWARSSQLEFEVVEESITVDLSDFRLVFRSAGHVLADSEAAVGSPSNPTPIGTYFVTDVVKLADPSGPWGPFALGLSAHSDTITEFNGGDGIVGIHGTNRPAKIGQPVSLGCIRVPNEVIEEIAAVIRLGTPVEIVA